MIGLPAAARLGGAFLHGGNRVLARCRDALHCDLLNQAAPHLWGPLRYVIYQAPSIVVLDVVPRRLRHPLAHVAGAPTVIGLGEYTLLEQRSDGVVIPAM